MADEDRVVNEVEAEEDPDVLRVLEYVLFDYFQIKKFASSF